MFLTNKYSLVYICLVFIIKHDFARNTDVPGLTE